MFVTAALLAFSGRALPTLPSIITSSTLAPGAEKIPHNQTCHQPSVAIAIQNNNHHDNVNKNIHSNHDGLLSLLQTLISANFFLTLCAKDSHRVSYQLAGAQASLQSDSSRLPVAVGCLPVPPNVALLTALGHLLDGLL